MYSFEAFNYVHQPGLHAWHGCASVLYRPGLQAALGDVLCWPCSKYGCRDWQRLLSLSDGSHKEHVAAHVILVSLTCVMAQPCKCLESHPRNQLVHVKHRGAHASTAAGIRKGGHDPSKT